MTASDPFRLFDEMLKHSASPRLQFVIASIVGLLFGLFQRYFFWAIYPIDNPVTEWLVEEFAKKGKSGHFYLFTHVHDFVVHLLLALGLAIILIRVFGPRRWVQVVVVIVAWHAVMFWDAVWSNMGIVFSYWGFWINLVTTLSVVPIAYMLVEKINRNSATI